MTRVAVVMVAYGDEPMLSAAVSSALASTGVRVQVVLVDNGADPTAVEEVRGMPGVTVLTPGGNLGFAGGCNAGVAASDAEVVVLFNCDASLAPEAIAHLVEALTDPGVGVATASVRLADQPGRMNSAGNPVHYLGLAWSGGHGQPVERYATAGAVASASGACCAMTRSWWQVLGGFQEAYFAYHEDVELSIRTWQRGRSVVYVPSAIAWHHYEFDRNPTKLYLLERNRLMTVLTTYSGRTLALLAPALAAQEAALVAASLAQGWWRSKLTGYGWLIRHRRDLLERHRRLQAQRCLPDKDVMTRFAACFDAGNVTPPRGLGTLNRACVLYRRLVQRWL